MELSRALKSPKGTPSPQDREGACLGAGGEIAHPPPGGAGGGYICTMRHFQGIAKKQLLLCPPARQEFPHLAQPSLARPHDGLGTIHDLELAEDIRHMVPDRFRSQTQALRDLGIGPVLGDQRQDLLLPLR